MPPPTAKMAEIYANRLLFCLLAYVLIHITRNQNYLKHFNLNLL